MVTELGFRDGMTPPSDLPAGECILTTLCGDDGQPTGLYIVRADPRILISEELLDLIVDAPAPGVWLDLAGCTTYDDGLLKIHGANRTVIYRITGYEPSVHGYIAEWPD
jgi:hypothetical protein